MFRRTLPLLMIPGLAAALAAMAWAQITSRPIDSGHSYASFWLGRNVEGSEPVNVGVAQAAGSVTLDASNPPASTLAFNLVPGGEGAGLLAPDGSIRSGEVARLMRYTVMSFRTTHTRVRRDAFLEFTGELTITHVTREQIPGAWNSANNTPSYTDPETTRATRTVSFVLATPRAEFLAAYLQKHSEITATATIQAGDFPELPDAVLDAYWPIVAEDEHCEPPIGTPGGRDYAGVICTGKAVTTTNRSSGAPTFGLDYSGPRKLVAPVDGPVTILLYLKLAPADAAGPKPPGN